MCHLFLCTSLGLISGITKKGKKTHLCHKLHCKPGVLTTRLPDKSGDDFLHIFTKLNFAEHSQNIPLVPHSSERKREDSQWVLLLLFEGQIHINLKNYESLCCTPETCKIFKSALPQFEKETIIHLWLEPEAWSSGTLGCKDILHVKWNENVSFGICACCWL